MLSELVDAAVVPERRTRGLDGIAELVPDCGRGRVKALVRPAQLPAQTPGSSASDAASRRRPGAAESWYEPVIPASWTVTWTSRAATRWSNRSRLAGAGPYAATTERASGPTSATPFAPSATNAGRDQALEHRGQIPERIAPGGEFPVDQPEPIGRRGRGGPGRCPISRRRGSRQPAATPARVVEQRDHRALAERGRDGGICSRVLDDEVGGPADPSSSTQGRPAGRACSRAAGGGAHSWRRARICASSTTSDADSPSSAGRLRSGCASGMPSSTSQAPALAARGAPTAGARGRRGPARTRASGRRPAPRRPTRPRRGRPA